MEYPCPSCEVVYPDEMGTMNGSPLGLWKLLEHLAQTH